ncbi:MAG: penicillin-binding protein 1A [Coxiellaceae bacterium]|nr:penicillin-binding protein 1A [Coxiellaceae bacterium]
MRIFRYIADHSLWTILSVVFTVIIILIAVYSYIELALPSVEKLKDVHMQVPLKIYGKNGKLIAQYGVKRRIPVTLNEIPKPLVEAVIATEDARFYDHPGVDFISLVRAAKAVVSSGRKVQGASTITMQVARNFFLTRKKTYTRKINEILLAIKIDREFSKDKILELYLNKIYLGNRAYGVAAAARVYYGKRLGQLTLPEMAMIAGLPQAPSSDNPIANPKDALERRNHVLARMLDNNYIDKATYDRAIQAPITARYHRQKVQLYAPFVSEMVRLAMIDHFGKSVYESGYSVYTTIDADLQAASKMALDTGLEAYDRRHGYRKPEHNWGAYTADNADDWQKQLTDMTVIHGMQPAAVIDVQPQSFTALLADGQQATVEWAGMKWARPWIEKRRYPGRSPKQASDVVAVGDVIRLSQNKKQQWQLAQIPTVQGAIVSLSPVDGSVLALSGGYDYLLSHFNRVTQAVRQPGSNFKPFIYSAALAKGFTLATIINDAPVVIADTGENQLWRPRNDTQKFYGPTSVRTGLVKSRNLVSIRLLQDTGIPFTLKYLQRFGFNPDNMPRALSLALGSAGVTPMQIASGYTVFANGGYRVQPYFIDHIADQNGEEIYRANPAKACTACLSDPHLAADQMPQPVADSVITPQNAYLINTALQGVIQQGTGRKALALKRTDLAGKTGTTNKQVDAWFSGYNHLVQATVWVGFDDSEDSLYEYGSQAALPIWMDYMQQALKGMPEQALPQPPGLVSVRIDPRTGLLATAADNSAVFQLFRQQYAPTEFSTAAPQQPTALARSSNAPVTADESAGDDAPLF